MILRLENLIQQGIQPVRLFCEAFYVAKFQIPLHHLIMIRHIKQVYYLESAKLASQKLFSLLFQIHGTPLLSVI